MHSSVLTGRCIALSSTVDIAREIYGTAILFGLLTLAPAHV